MAVLAAYVVEHRDGAGMFDHVLIDEAQDFHAGHWRFLRVRRGGAERYFLAETPPRASTANARVGPLWY